VFPPDYGCDDRLLLDSCTLQQLLYMWLAPAVLAFSCLGLLVLRAQLNTHEQHRRGPFGRLSTRLLPPQRFWLWWCGGLSVSDALAVAFWAAFNAAWAVAVLTRFFSLIPFFSKVSPRECVLFLGWSCAGRMEGGREAASRQAAGQQGENTACVHCVCVHARRGWAVAGGCRRTRGCSSTQH
jgi:hypothetical protein